MIETTFILENRGMKLRTYVTLGRKDQATCRPDV